VTQHLEQSVLNVLLQLWDLRGQLSQGRRQRWALDKIENDE
jgi:hypothetical protein